MPKHDTRQGAERLTLTAFRLPAEILDGLRHVRERDGVGVSEQVRRALAARLKERKALPPSKARKGDATEMEDEYLEKLPEAVPAGRVLVHNHVRPARRLGTRGFQAWLATPDAKELEVCDCGWAAALGPHRRVREDRRALPKNTKGVR